MRVETVTRNLYKFEELSPESQEAAVEKLWDINVDYEWWENVYWDAENIGLKITSFDLDHHEIEGKFTRSAEDVAAKIFENHGHKCDTYETADKFIKAWQPVCDRYMDEEGEDFESGELEDIMMDMEKDFLRSLLEDYRIMLRREYEYLTSEEAIRETIDANEYEFTENGVLA